MNYSMNRGPNMEETMNQSNRLRVHVNNVFFASDLIVRTTIKLAERVHATLISITCDQQSDFEDQLSDISRIRNGEFRVLK